jgi:hypothetical protein
MPTIGVPARTASVYSPIISDPDEHTRWHRDPDRHHRVEECRHLVVGNSQRDGYPGHQQKSHGTPRSPEQAGSGGSAVTGGDDTQGTHTLQSASAPPAIAPARMAAMVDDSDFSQFDRDSPAAS